MTPSLDASNTMTDYTSFFTFEGGDIKVIATFKGQRIVGKVNSQCMVAASPVWKKFIFPPWLSLSQPPSQQSDVEGIFDGIGGMQITSTPLPEPQKIDCSEDDGHALLVLLRIAHFRFEGVPTSLTTDTMLNVALLCEQYLCRNLVLPWTSKWLTNATTRSTFGWPEPWLYIAHTFGDAKLLEHVARKVVMEAEFPSDGELTVRRHGGGSRELQEPLPSGLLESIEEVRQDTIKALLAVVYRHIDQFGGLEQRPCQRGSIECGVCKYQRLILHLRSLGIFPRCETYEGGLEKFSKIVAKIGDLLWYDHTNKIGQHYAGRGNTGDYHEVCFKGTYASEV
ncbi:uncharacterized protein PAC_14593 [Phialocephala subalpina]|uniref:BTB domain-containing protein n=1 Tax=Phialocephala subalpina TaxID=576137 RepID=A0A1L7XI41_9HELO|nr:uncharacterized protein PAC_14593 [Phialocephala subalpina]